MMFDLKKQLRHGKKRTWLQRWLRPILMMGLAVAWIWCISTLKQSVGADGPLEFDNETWLRLVRRGLEDSALPRLTEEMEVAFARAGEVEALAQTVVDIVGDASGTIDAVFRTKPGEGERWLALGYADEDAVRTGPPRWRLHMAPEVCAVIRQRMEEAPVFLVVRFMVMSSTLALVSSADEDENEDAMRMSAAAVQIAGVDVYEVTPEGRAVKLGSTERVVPVE